MPNGMPEDFPRTLGELLGRSAARWGEREAIALDERRWTYARLRAEADRVAAGLIAAGIGKGTRIGILLPNRPEWLAAAFGAFQVGAWAIGLNTLHRRAELEYTLRHADVSTLIAVPRFLKADYEAMLREIAPEVFAGRLSTRLPALRRVIFADDERRGEGSLSRFLEAGEGIPGDVRQAVGAAIRPSDPAAVFFTSGSTAAPKAAVHTHASLTYSAWAIGDHLGLGPEDRTWTALPLFFSGGFCLCAVSSLAAGACVVLNEVFEAGAALGKLERERCTVMVGYNHAAAMVEHPGFAATRLSLHKGVGGNLELADRFLGPGHVAVGNYGMTETATICCSARWTDPPEIRRTFGRPIPGASVQIVNPDTGEVLAPGEEGEIIVRSPAQMSHYYGTSPAECFDERGYFHTGDLGFFDANGCLQFAKRLKDVIKTMGVNVAAPEIEAVLERHPGVRRAHVVGVPHPSRGENIAAFVVGAEGVPTERELRDLCARELAPYKAPRHFFFCREEELPISASGKIEKGRLRERALQAIGGTEK